MKNICHFLINSKIIKLVLLKIFQSKNKYKKIIIFILYFFMKNFNIYMYVRGNNTKSNILLMKFSLKMIIHTKNQLFIFNYNIFVYFNF